MTDRARGKKQKINSPDRESAGVFCRGEVLRNHRKAGGSISRAVEKRECVSTRQCVCVCVCERESGIECGRSLDDDRWPVNGNVNDMEM